LGDPQSLELCSTLIYGVRISFESFSGVSVSAIAQKVHVSKSTMYSYLRHRGVEIGLHEKPASRCSDANAATILLSLRIENNSKFVRGKKRATEQIERYFFQKYNAKRQPDGEYELKVPYNSDEDLDQTMGELLGDIASQTDDRNCFSESNAHMHDADRHWG
jgi:AcrR family transcriptional regulator